MSSLVRNLERKVARKNKSTYEPKPQATVLLGDGGYVTIRYTRGPRRISGRRLRAQGAVAAILHPGQERQQQAEVTRALASIDRQIADQKRIRELRAAPVASISRQVRRAAIRTGEALPPLLNAVEVPADKPKRARKPRAKKVAEQ